MCLSQSSKTRKEENLPFCKHMYMLKSGYKRIECPRKIRDKKNSVQKLPVASFE